MKSPVSTSASYAVPVFQTVLETAQGGFTLDDSVAVTAGLEVAAGTVIGFDESTRKAKVGKFGVAQASATNSATAYRVLKGHTLAVGMTIKAEDGGTGRAIDSIDATDPDYDELTVLTTIGQAVDAGDALYVDDIGYSAPKGLAYAPFTAEGNAEVAVMNRGTVYHRRVPPVPAVVKAKLPNIIFSESY